MQRDLGQQIVVENVGGAGGTLGAGRAAKAEPDGYTLLLHHIGMATSAILYRSLTYKPLEDFAPMSTFGAPTAASLSAGPAGSSDTQDGGT